jgi:hypothetical protein
MEVHLQVVNGIFLAAQKEHDFIIDELKLPSHLFIDVIDLVHGTNGAVYSLEVGQILMKGTFKTSLFLSAQSALLPLCSLSQQVFLATVCNKQRSCVFKGLFGLKPV